MIRGSDGHYRHRATGRLVVFHRTTQAAAAAIERSGFRDHGDPPGVWLASRPLDEAPWDRDAMLELALDEQRLDSYAQRYPGIDGRVWLVPAAVLNEHAEILAWWDSEPILGSWLGPFPAVADENS